MCLWWLITIISILGISWYCHHTASCDGWRKKPRYTLLFIEVTLQSVHGTEHGTYNENPQFGLCSNKNKKSSSVWISNEVKFFYWVVIDYYHYVSMSDLFQLVLSKGWTRNNFLSAVGYYLVWACAKHLWDSCQAIRCFHLCPSMDFNISFRTHCSP